MGERRDSTEFNMGLTNGRLTASTTLLPYLIRRGVDTLGEEEVLKLQETGKSVSGKVLKEVLNKLQLSLPESREDFIAGFIVGYRGEFRRLINSFQRMGDQPNPSNQSSA